MTFAFLRSSHCQLRLIRVKGRRALLKLVSCACVPAVTVAES